MQDLTKINIRSITLGLESGNLNFNQEEIVSFFKMAYTSFESEGRMVRTKRICLSPLNNDREFSQERVLSIIDKVQKYALASQIRWICVPFNLCQDRPDMRIEKIAHDIIKKYDNCFVNLLVADDQKVSIQGAQIGARVIKKVAMLSRNGFDNFRLGISSNCKPNTPFFPFSYHHGKNPGFSLAIESLGFLLKNLEGKKINSLNEFREKAVSLLTDELKEIQKIGEQIQTKTQFEFKGVDISLAPYPGEQSIVDILAKLGVEFGGSYGTVFVTSVLTDILRKSIVDSEIKSVGFNGVMYSLLEDSRLAKNSNINMFSIDSMMLFATVCGCGLDMIPIPGETFDDEIASMILDISALAVNLKKPLGVRLLPTPLESKDQFTDYNYDFLVNTRVKPVKNSAFEFHSFVDNLVGFLSLRK